MNEDAVERYCWDCMSDPLSKPFYQKMLEWKNNNSPCWRELTMMLTRAEKGEFKS